MKLKLTLRAEADIDEIAAYIEARNPQTAKRVEAELNTAFRLLESYPLAGRTTRRGVRRLVLPRYPYLIFYGLDDASDTIIVFTVRHASRRERQALVDRR